MGMEVFEKLSLLESSLKIIRSAFLAVEGIPSAAVIETLPLNPGDYWKSMALLSSSGRQYRLLGQLERVPEFSSSDRQLLATGKPLVKAVYGGEGGGSRIFMSLIMNPKQTEPDILVGEIENGYLWNPGDSRLLPAYVHGCILDQTGITLICDSTAPAQLPRRIKGVAERRAIGDDEWNENGRSYLASYWSLPIKYEFQTSDWIVALGTSNEGAFASLGEIQKPFLLGIVISLGLSVLFGIYNIRKRLVPVELLQEGTRRIAANEFSFKVNIRSNDEFEELANSVNAMASQLGRQFDLLISKSDIDRAVLSLLNTDAIVGAVLSRLMNIFPCDAASVLLVGTAEESTDHLYVAKAADAEKSTSCEQTPHPSHLKPVDAGLGGHFAFSIGISRAETKKGENRLLKRLANAEVPLVFNENMFELLDSELIDLRGVHSMMAAPLIVKDDVVAVLAFYSKEPNQFSARDLEFFQSITRQVAIAIYNAQLFETVKHQAAELEKSNKAKDEFLGIMSHELRTPMNVILGYLALLHEGMLGELNEEQNMALDKVAKHSQGLLEMIEGIMEATKIESGAVMIETDQVDVPLMFNELKAEYNVLPRGEGVALLWFCAANLPMLQTDRFKLMQILRNLISNAIKFTDEGSIIVSAAYLPEHSLLQFQVEDTGIGIPQESQTRIFEIFCQGDSSKTRKYGGIGLGLYIVKKLSALMGANIGLKSESGHGSTFTVTVPIDHRTAVPANGENMLPPNDCSHIHPAEPYKVSPQQRQ
jgi:signal transduction histidine kinase